MTLRRRNKRYQSIGLFFGRSKPLKIKFLRSVGGDEERLGGGGAGNSQVGVAGQMFYLADRIFLFLGRGHHRKGNNSSAKHLAKKRKERMAGASQSKEGPRWVDTRSCVPTGDT